VENTPQIYRNWQTFVKSVKMLGKKVSSRTLRLDEEEKL